jgi:isoquinoline 1-oxidoreductase beta subunit
MGQGTYQAIPQIIAEELEVSLDQVSVGFAAANPKKFGPQPQEGSFSGRGWYQELLRAGAAAREMLIEAASMQWKVPPTECYAENGHVIHRPTGKKLAYGALVKEASSLTPPQHVTLKERKDYKIIGKSLPRLDAGLKTNGAAIFGLDKKLPGMMYAMVERNPRFRGKVKSFDDSATKAVPGVKYVFKVQRPVFEKLYEGVAVVADTLWAAMQGRKVLKVEWDDDGFEHPDSEQLVANMKEDLKKPVPSKDFEAAFNNAVKKIEVIYETPYQSHSAMEPLNCTADVRENSIEIWGPIQEANLVQADLSERMGIPAKNVSVNMTFLGGGFGRKAFIDYTYEAALISREIKAPVQIVWSREDDMTMGPFRPGALYGCKGGLDANGNIIAFQMVTASQPFGTGSDTDAVSEPISLNSGTISGLLKPYYESIPHYGFGGTSVKSPIPVMWWRAPSACTAGFACECFIDELAHATGKDPLEFRKNYLRDDRYLALINKLEMISKWKLRGKNEGWGVAITECFGSIVAHIVKVSLNADKKIRIDKVIALMDCGWYVNPDILPSKSILWIIMRRPAVWVNQV